MKRFLVSFWDLQNIAQEQKIQKDMTICQSVFIAGPHLMSRSVEERIRCMDLSMYVSLKINNNIS